MDLTLPNRIDPTEQAYLKKLVEDLKPGQDRMNGFTGFLTSKYDLGPKDSLSLDGIITRATD